MWKFNIHLGWRSSKDYILKFTPGCSNTWKNIEYVDIDDVDYNVILQIPTLCLKNSIHFRREPESHQRTSPWTEPVNSLYNFDYSSKNRFHAATWHIEKTYDELINMKYQPEKLVSVVVSQKYPWRVKYVKHVKSCYEDLRMAGRITGKSISVKERGDVLQQSRMSICIENSAQENYFTEKIVDCLLSWTLPLYWGCPNIHEFFPQDSYRLIDINNPEQILDTINKPITSTEIDAMETARKLILDKYNIWHCIHTIINKNNADTI